MLIPEEKSNQIVSSQRRILLLLLPSSPRRPWRLHIPVTPTAPTDDKPNDPPQHAPFVIPLSRASPPAGAALLVPFQRLPDPGPAQKPGGAQYEPPNDDLILS